MPRISDPTVSASLPGRQPITTASIVRTRLIFTMPVRSPGRYGARTSLATTPSPLRRHGAASAGSRVRGRHAVFPPHQLFEPGSPSLKRSGQPRVLLAREQVEGDIAGGSLL